MKGLVANVAFSTLIVATVIACASGADIERVDTPMSEDPDTLLPLPDASADPAAASKPDPKEKGDGGKNGADAAPPTPPTPPSGAIIADGTEQGQVVGSVVLGTSATVEGRIDDDDDCPSTAPWIKGSFPFATIAIHNPVPNPLWVDVRAQLPGVSVIAYAGTNVPMTMAARSACEVSSFDGHLVDTVFLDPYASKLLFVTSAAPLGPNVTIGTVPLELTTFLKP